MVPKMAVLVASIPQFVLGGAGLVMFGMVLATGIRILARINYSSNRYNLYIVAISLGVGLTPTLSHDFSQNSRQYCSRYCMAGSCWPRSAPSPSICSLTVTTNTRG
jgi:xanthine/uracil permease